MEKAERGRNKIVPKPLDVMGKDHLVNCHGGEVLRFSFSFSNKKFEGRPEEPRDLPRFVRRLRG